MLIHKMRLDDNMAVLDVNSGAVHLVEKKQKEDGNNTKILQRPHRRAEAAVC